MTKNWMQKLQNLEGAVVGSYNPFARVVRSPSPSLNFIFGKGHGLPLGYSMVLYGPPKAGKTLIANAMVGQLHRDDPEAIVIKFDTEFREQGQLSDKDAETWGIDKSRYICYSVNSPKLVFDRIEKDIAAMCDAGAPIRMVIIDSISGIQGRREMNADTVETQQIGDHALTIQTGLKRILPVQRKHKIAMILTAHARAEMDMAEQMRGNKIKMQAGFGVQHHAEYFVLVQPNKSKEGKTDLLGNKFVNEELGDMNDNAELTGHKIRVQMRDSSIGPKMRSAEFTIDYSKGVVNTHEEVFLLGLNRGVISKPNNVKYAFGDKEWHGKPATLEALRMDSTLREEILAELRRRDMAGMFDADDEKAEESP